MKTRRPRPGTRGAAGTGTEQPDPTPRLSTDPPPDQVSAVTGAHRPTLTVAISPHDMLGWDLDLISTLTTFSRRLLERELAAGRFPPPSARCGRRMAWRPSTVIAWMEKGGTNGGS
jgi:predicted DNA-binding transcriptional regulator AlpA